MYIISMKKTERRKNESELYELPKLLGLYVRVGFLFACFRHLEIGASGIVIRYPKMCLKNHCIAGVYSRGV